MAIDSIVPISVDLRPAATETPPAFANVRAHILERLRQAYGEGLLGAEVEQDQTVL